MYVCPDHRETLSTYSTFLVCQFGELSGTHLYIGLFFRHHKILHDVCSSLWHEKFSLKIHYVSVFKNMIYHLPMLDVDYECFKNRVELVVRNLRHCNSGAEIHEVNNMRTFAQLLLLKILDRQWDDNLNRDICRLEKRCVEFFKKKFNGL